MIWDAPASRAAAIACIPTPPQPTTQTRSPMPTRAAWLTAPYPVTAPQPSSDACHSGSSAGIGIAACSATTAYSAKQATLKQCCNAAVVGIGQTRAAVGQDAREPVGAGRLAQRAVTDAAGLALAARDDHRQHDVIAGRQMLDARADGVDDTGTLVAEHERPAAVAEFAVGEVQVGVADAGGGDPDADLAGAGSGQRHGLGRDGSGFPQDAGAHLHGVVRGHVSVRGLGVVRRRTATESRPSTSRRTRSGQGDGGGRGRLGEGSGSPRAQAR